MRLLNSQILGILFAATGIFASGIPRKIKVSKELGKRANRSNAPQAYTLGNHGFKIEYLAIDSLVCLPQK